MEWDCPFRSTDSKWELFLTPTVVHVHAELATVEWPVDKPSQNPGENSGTVCVLSNARLHQVSTDDREYGFYMSCMHNTDIGVNIQE